MSDSERAKDAAIAAAHNRRILHHRFFFGYVYGAFRTTPLYSVWQKWLAVFRRFRTITIILRILTVLFTFLQTGTLVILSALILLIILPLLIVLMLGILITAAIESRRSNGYLKKALAKRPVCVLFQPSDQTAFFPQHAKRLIQEGFSVIVVSPFFISAKGLLSTEKKQPFYCTCRRESHNLYLVRRYYFFSLRKHVLQNLEVAYLF